jgi:antitoxin component of RelBE/YafQ-DinJ toxin-antitoxin module
MIKVLKSRLAGVELIGCFFHFRKALWRKLQELGLTSFYNSNPAFQMWVNMVAALSYVPVEQVAEYYNSVILQILQEHDQHQEDAGSSTDEEVEEEQEDLHEQDEEEEEEEEEKEEEEGNIDDGEAEDTGTWTYSMVDIRSYVDYLEKTWLGKKIEVATRKSVTVTQKKPLFPVQLWNQFRLVSTDEEAGAPEGTNNMMESYNRTLNKLLGVNPNIWTAISCFIKQEAETRHTLVSNVAGLGLTGNTGRKRQVEQNHAMICSTVRRLNDLSPTIYLKAVARILNGDH